MQGASVQLSELPGVVGAIRGLPSGVAPCLELLVLTGARPKDITSLRRGSLQLAGDETWDAERPARAFKPFRRPLSAASLRLLYGAVQRLADSEDDALVFPGESGAEMASAALLRRLRSIDPRLSLTTFRSCFAEWLALTQAPVSAAQVALGLKPTEWDVKFRFSADANKNMRDRVRTLMEAWAGLCLQGTSPATSIPQLRSFDRQ